MSYIRRENAIIALETLDYSPGEWCVCGLSLCEQAILGVPSEDVVPVVRCRVCRFSRVKHQDMYLCYKAGNEEFPDYHDPDFFCADGQRREK